MSAPDIPIILDVIEEHLEELRFLLERPSSTSRSPEYVISNLRDLEEPTEAHVDALLIAGERIFPLLEERLSAEDPSRVFTAAYVLLRSEAQGVSERVIGAFADSEGERLRGLRDALCYNSIAAMLPQLRDIVESAPAPVAVAAAEVLAFHGRLEPKVKRLTELVQDNNAEVRKAAWRVVAMVDSKAPV